ncbi:MAG: hypothetical protein N2560_07130 [Ignavibacteria bacterium]|nr:hypothetical protein [Ignavibacteria bacterium]
MSKIIYILAFNITFLTILKIELFCQCGCSSAQQFLPPLHWIGKSEFTIAAKKRLFLDLIYKHSLSNKIYKGSKSISSIDFFYHSFDLFASYGFSNYSAIDLFINYNLRELNQFQFVSKSSGFSHLSLGGRHTFYESENSDFIINAGLGVRLPLTKFKPIDSIPIVVQPSNGAFGFYGFGLIQKSFPSLNLNLLFFNRFDYFFENNLDYQFGPTNSSSILISLRISESLSALLELRNIFSLQDKHIDTIFTNSGVNLLLVIPRATISFDNLSISPFCEIPIFQYYKGEQIASKIAFGFNLNYLLNFSKRKL